MLTYFYINVWIWYKYQYILFYSCLNFFNQFNEFVNIFFIHVRIWYNCKQISSTHNFCAHNFLPWAIKHSDLCAFKFLLWTPVYRCNLINWIVIWYICMRIKNITVFLSFFLSFPEFFLVIRYFVWESQFSCGSWQDWRDHRPTHHPAHAGFRPHTTMNHFYMNDDVIGRFSFSAPFLRPSTGISASFLIFLHAISFRSPHFCWLLCFWQVSWLFLVFSFYVIARKIFILCFHFWGIPVDFLPLFDFVQGSQPIRAKKIMWWGIRTKQFLLGQVSQRESICFYIHNLDHIGMYITFFHYRNLVYI